MDPTYLALTRRPFVLDSEGSKILQESSIAFIDNAEEAEEDANSDDERDSGHSTGPEIVPDSTLCQARVNRLAEQPCYRSIYGQHYRKITTSNVGFNGEPACTNFAHVYRGTLDYIFVPQDSSIRCSSLLDVPSVSTLRQSQPNEGEFPSDHFALASVLVIEGIPRQ